MENIKIKTYKAEALTPSKGLRYSKDENGKQVLVGVGTCKDERIVVPNGVQIVGARAFENCEAKEILLPNSIEEIQDAAFAGCPSLAYLRLPNLVDAVPAFAFSDCPDFGVLLAPSQLRDLGKNAFFGTSSICYLYSSERDGWRTGFSASQMERMVASEMNWPSYPQAGKNMKSDLRMENDQLFFGSYPQSAADESMETLLEKKHPGETYAEENGQCFYFNRGHWYRYEPIEWKIIDKDGDDVLVIAKKALVYHESSIDFSGYENSSGRKFLNSDFIDAAFSEKEKEKILTTKLDNSPYFFGQEYSSLPPDPETESFYASTEDKIFLLSYAEWERLLKGKEPDRLELTDYAKSFSKDWPDQFPWWWLRTISDVTSWYPLCVRPEFQSISPWKGDFFLYLRPAMWLRLGK
jgi:hypothetical protein